MWTNNLPDVLADSLAAIFAVAAIIGMAATRHLHERFRRWRHPGQFYRMISELLLLTALFLALPEMRLWGIALAGFILFWGVVSLLNHRRWGFAVAGMLMMTALAPASLASTGRPADTAIIALR